MKDLRIYSQLAPDKAGVQWLLSAQSELSDPDRGRVLPEQELHMTVIHFGKVEEVYERVNEHIDVSREAFNEALSVLITNLNESMNDLSFELRHTGFERFGKNGKTIVATFDVIDPLKELHSEQLGYVTTFFERCGLEDANRYMKNDPNFMYALDLRPHVTLKKGHENHDLPTATNRLTTFHPMDVTY